MWALGRNVHTAYLGDNLQERVSQPAYKSNITDNEKVCQVYQRNISEPQILLSIEVFWNLTPDTTTTTAELSALVTKIFLLQYFYQIIFIKTGQFCQGRSQESVRNRKIYRNPWGRDFTTNSWRTNTGNK